MNNAGSTGNNFVSGVVSGTGIVCSPYPITRVGTVSVSPAVLASVATQSAKTQNIEAVAGSTQVNGVFQVRDLTVDPLFVVDPTAALVVHGATVSVANLQPSSEGSTVGSMELPFNRVHAHTLSTPQTDLNALGVLASNNSVAIMALTEVTQNMSASPDVTNVAGQVIANMFVKDGGTSNQFLMADGCTGKQQQ